MVLHFTNYSASVKPLKRFYSSHAKTRPRPAIILWMDFAGDVALMNHLQLLLPCFLWQGKISSFA